MRQGAQGWCTRMTQRDGMRRELGGVSEWGTNVHPWLIRVNVWQKPLQYCKVKLNIQKTKIMASGSISSWQIDGEIVRDFIFLGSKVTADGDCSHEIRRRLLLRRKVMTNLDSILKRRDVALEQRSA